MHSRPYLLQAASSRITGYIFDGRARTPCTSIQHPSSALSDVIPILSWKLLPAEPTFIHSIEDQTTYEERGGRIRRSAWREEGVCVCVR